MKKLIFLLFLLPFFARAQTYQSMPQAGYGPVKRMLFDSVLTLPLGIAKLQNISGGRDVGQIRYNVIDSSLYTYSGTRWIKSGIDTSTIYYNLGLKLNISDTAQMMAAAPRVQRFLDSVANLKSSIDLKLNKTDTASLSNRINLKVNITDTAAMLAPYTLTTTTALKLNIADTAAMLTPYTRATQTALKLNISDTASMLSAYTRLTANALKLNISDTAAMMAAAPRVQRFLDSVANLKTSIATKQNTLTLTTTGTSGAATLTGATLNIPQYSGTNIYNANGSLTSNRTLTLNSQPLTFLGTTRTRFHANGRMTIGDTTDQGFILDVRGNTKVTGNINVSAGYIGFSDVYTGADPTNVFQNNTLNLYANTGGNAYAKIGLNANSQMYFKNTAAGVGFAWYQNTTQTNARINNAGNFEQASGFWGFGDNITTAADPTNSTQNHTYAYFYTGSNVYKTGLAAIRASKFDMYWQTGSSSGGGFRWYQGTNELASISKDGNLLLNTTTDLASSILTMNSTTKGFLPPRMTTTQINAIASPAVGLVVYNTTLNVLCVYTGTWQKMTTLPM